MNDITRKKISASLKGKPLSEEHKKKLSEILKGRVFSEEHKRKIGEANRRRKFSNETKEKIRQKALGRNKGKPLPEGMKTKILHVFVEGIESKQCSDCKEVKPIIDFGQYSAASNGSGLAYYCKLCARIHRKKHRQKTHYKMKNKKDNRLRRYAIKEQAINYMGGQCADCKYLYRKMENESAFDFHHVNPKEKDFALSAVNSRSFERIKSELDKCVLLCAVCHRIRHQKEGMLKNDLT